MFFVIPTQCKMCKEKFDSVYNIRGGICSDCMVKNVPLEEALKGTCSCFHNKVYKLYADAIKSG